MRLLRRDMLRGIPPYVLAYNMKFPGSYGVYPAIMAIFGQTIAGIYMGFLLINADPIILIFSLAERLFSLRGGGRGETIYGFFSESIRVVFGRARDAFCDAAGSRGNAPTPPKKSDRGASGGPLPGVCGLALFF